MEDSNFFSRRDFLRGVGAAGAAGLTLWAGGCESCRNQIEHRPTRRNISNLAANDPIIQTYKDAVAAMKALPASDNRNWTKQANIHNSSCTHGNWFFLPWHRMYLLYFEKICRKLTGNNDFALPYWNWTTHPAVPDVFWDTNSPLYDANRFVTQSDQASASWVGAPAIENILSQTNFNLFASGPPVGGQLHFATNTGMLEQTPHNNIHSWISGDMGSFMSPLDPVFWTHHNMLDCLWVDWNINRNNPNTNDTAWTNKTFSDFFDENGNPVSVEVIVTVLYPIFLYQYEACGPTAQTSKMAADKKALETWLRQGAPSKIEFIKKFELRQSVTSELQKASAGSIKVEPEALRTVLESGGKNKAVLTIDEVEVPEKRDFFVRVFLNKPDASGQTPMDDPHYAGSFGFFFDESMKSEPGMAMTGRPKAGYLVDVTPTLRKLGQAGSLGGGQLDVTLVPVPYDRRQAPGQHVTLGRLELGIAQF